MRDAATAARGAGVNIAFLGANAIYRHIRLEPSPLGDDRHVVAYKNADEDPLFRREQRRGHGQLARRPGVQARERVAGRDVRMQPRARRHQVMNDAEQWVFKDTGMHDGARIPGAVDVEYNRHRLRTLPRRGRSR